MATSLLALVLAAQAASGRVLLRTYGRRAEPETAAQALFAALRALPGDQARVLELSYFAERSHAEIGRELCLPLGTVKGRLRLALARLRAALEDDGA